MSSFPVDQFMQVRCKFQLTSETESSESIHSNNEKVRLCTSVDFDRNSTLIVMICSNETGNNHIVAYYIERRLHTTPISIDTSFSSIKLDNEDQRSPNRSQQNLTFSLLAAVSNQAQQQQLQNQHHHHQGHQQQQQLYLQSPYRSGNGFIKRTKPRIIVKQIYYHSYNEDIVALSLSDSGNRLVLISASSTIYILPIKNILLNLHAKQLRSSQGKSMYFYDAVILDCCQLENPIAVACFESSESENKTTIIVANEKGQLSFISLEEKKEISGTYVNERIKFLKIIRDRFGYSLLITCHSFKQYRFVLELFKQQQQQLDAQNSPDSRNQRAEANQNMYSIDEYAALKIPDIMPSWDRKPIPITLHRNSHSHGSGAGGGGLAAAAAIQRVLTSSSRSSSQGGGSGGVGGIFSRERSPLLISYHQPNLISVIDVLGTQKAQATLSNRVQAPESRLLRFFSSKQFYYKPQKPTLVCKLSCLEADEMIIQTVLTDRFIAIATDRDRCLINSRNCCNPLRNPSNSPIELDPLVKEISFNTEEKILLLLKSPVSNDQDNIIDSFLLVTNRSIYSIEARQSCRDMFINLIDSHLGIRPPSRRKSITGALISSALNPNDFSSIEVYTAQRKNSESNLIVSSFLSQRDEVYEKINYDSRAFSFIFKIELNSLYEAYADKLLLRNRFELANRFFQMAKFNHTKITGKYIRLGAYKQTIDYATNVLGDQNEILDEKERIDLSKDALDCLLAKTIVERSKTVLYSKKLKLGKMRKLMEYYEMRTANENNKQNSPIKCYDLLNRRWSQTSICKIDPYLLCEHSPQCQMAKLSANTIIVDHEQDDNEESTMTAYIKDDARRSSYNYQQQANNNSRSNRDTRLECEKALLNFINNYMAPSLYSYAMTQLVDFGLVDLAEIIARNNSRIHSLIKILLKAKGENRIIFRDGRFENLVDKLTGSNYNNLVRIDNTKPQVLEFITSPEVVKTLVKDIHLTCEYLGYQPTLMQFRKYSFATLCQLESFRKLVLLKRRQASSETCQATATTTNGLLFSKQEKQSIENIFIEFMNACLDESTDDSCRLWFNYINFYLNYVGTIDELEQDILNLLDSNVSDCRLAITLFKAINKDESGLEQQQVGGGGGGGRTFKTTEIVANTPLESMKELYNLCDLFRNEFLMKVLEKTLGTLF